MQEIREHSLRLWACSRITIPYGYSLISRCFKLSLGNARLKAGDLFRLHLVRDHSEPQIFYDLPLAHLRIGTTPSASKVRSELLPINNILLTALASCIKQKWEHACDIFRANLTDRTTE